MPDSDKNQALSKLYCSYLPNLYQLDVFKPNFSYPHLIHISSEYERCPHKLFIVGQDPGELSLVVGEKRYLYLGTSPWDENWRGGLQDNDIVRIVDALMEEDRNFQRGSYGRPFMQTAIDLSKRINPGFSDHSFGYSNLFKVSVGKKTPAGKVMENVLEAFPAIPEEIRIAKPDVLVFFTSSNRDPILKYYYPGLEFHCLKDFEKADLSVLKHGNLPCPTFRTWHPGYLNRPGRLGKEKKNAILDRMASIAKYSKDEISTYLRQCSYLCSKTWEIGDIDEHGFTLVATAGPFHVWNKGSRYDLCIYESEPIEQFDSLDAARPQMERRHKRYAS
ncbi:MAG: hypothetical protein ACUVTR_00010 [Dehalococcoidia bacterium]